MTVTATFIKKLSGFTGDARLYRLSAPVRYDDHGDEDGEKKHTQYVVVSATGAMFSGPETYMFPADPEGSILDWGEMHGSYKGDMNHERAIENAGWLLEGDGA
jgi:hypothetical protein